MVYSNKKLGEWSSGMILRLGILNNLSNKFRRGPGFDSQFAPIFFLEFISKIFFSNCLITLPNEHEIKCHSLFSFLFLFRFSNLDVGALAFSGRRCINNCFPSHHFYLILMYYIRNTSLLQFTFSYSPTQDW